MSTYIFRSEKLEHPIFIRFKPGSGYFLLAEGIRKHADSGKWEVQILQSFINYPWAKKCLIEGIRITVSNNKLVFVKLKSVFFYRKLRLCVDKTKVKRRWFPKHKLIF